MGWNERFKIASAKKSLDEVKRLDPEPYLASMGFDIVREGKHLKADNGERQVRSTLKEDGVWISCAKDGSRIGDNVDLVWHCEGRELGVQGAIKKLKESGERYVEKMDDKVLSPDRIPPRMPECGPADVENGRKYLVGRGIDIDIIKKAEETGFLAYNKSGVLFVGRDSEGVPQNITRRDIRPDEELVGKGEGFRAKADLKGSSKFWPQILPGDSREVWIVEGGVDALALQTMEKREGYPVPTIVVSGGARNRSFLDNPNVQTILKNAKEITVAFEKEKNQETQKQTDEDHMKQGIKIKEIIGEDKKMIITSYRPESGKDLADENLKLLQQQKPTQRLSHSSSGSGG